MLKQIPAEWVRFANLCGVQKAQDVFNNMRAEQYDSEDIRYGLQQNGYTVLEGRPGKFYASTTPNSQTVIELPLYPPAFCD